MSAILSLLLRLIRSKGADELVFLDITTTNEARGTLVQTVEAVANQVFMPLTVGGGIQSVADMHALLRAGADKVSLNSAAVADPSLLTAGAENLVAKRLLPRLIHVGKLIKNRYQVTVNGGRTPVDLDAITWAKQAVAAGAGELLVTSMDADGTESGFDLRLYQQLTAAVQVPIIASGGAGSTADFVQLFTQTTVSAGLAASIFHFGELTVPQVKTALKQSKGGGSMITLDWEKPMA